MSTLRHSRNGRDRDEVGRATNSVAMTAAPAPLTREEARRSTDAQVADVVRVLLLVTSIMLGVFAVFTPLTIPFPQGLAVAGAEVLLGLAYLGAHFVLKDPRATRFVHPIFAVLAIGAYSSILLTYAFTPNALLTTGVVLLTVGAGVIVLSWPWFTIIVALIVLTWAPLLVITAPGPAIVQVLSTLVVSVIIAALSHAARLRTHLKLEALRRHESRQREELEEGLRALRETEARLRSVVRAAPVILLATDARGRITLAEGRGLVARGWDQVSLLGRDAAEVLAPLPEERARFLAALAGKGSTGTAFRDGHWFDTFWTPALDPESGITGAICVATDVSERVRADEESRRVADREADIKRLQEMDRFKTSILNTASHELNTPLTPIKLQMHLLKRSFDEMDPRTQKAIALLDRNVDRLATLVSDITDVARIQAGQLKIAPADVELGDLAREAVASYEAVAASKKIALRLEALDKAPVHADPTRVLQILFNLLGNAMKFTPEGGSVTVRLSADAGRARAAVIDTGPGLSAEQIARLFRPFSQVHDVSRTGAGGTGLGLYISRGIAEQHGGSIGVASDGPGKGTTFTLELPLAG